MEPTGKPVLNVNIAAMRRGAGWGRGWWALRVLFPVPLKLPYPQHPQQVPSRSPQLRVTGLSIFTLLAASPINSQKLPNSSFESLQLPRLAIFSSNPQLLGMRCGSCWVTRSRSSAGVSVSFLPATEYLWKFLMSVSMALSTSLNSWASSALADRHCPIVPGTLVLPSVSRNY